MKLRTIIAENMSLAMDEIKENFGDRAVVLSSIPVNGHQLVKVIVGLADEDEIQKNELFMLDEMQDVRTHFFEKKLKRHHFSSVFINKLSNAVARKKIKVLDDKIITTALDSVLRFNSITPLQSNKVYILTGGAGVGKSLCVTKLALMAKKEGLNPAVISLDVFKVAGALELEKQCQLMGMPFVALKDTSLLQETVTMMRLQSDFILIDMPALNPYLPLHLDRLHFVKNQVADALCICVMPAGLQVQESIIQGSLFAKAGCQAVIASKLDCASSCAGLLEMCVHTQLPLIGFSLLNKVSNSIKSGDANTLTQLLCDKGE